MSSWPEQDALPFDNVDSQGETTEYLDQDVPAETRRFYRVRLVD